MPDLADRDAVAQFALFFNGYDHFGSFAAAADAALAKRRETLTDLRNELFMAFRGSNHRGDDAFVDVYRELLPLFMGRLKST